MTTGLERGRDAFGREAWSEAYEQLRAADRETPLSPEDLDRLATAAMLVGQMSASVEAHTRAYQEFLDRGDTGRAARSAVWLVLSMLDRPDQQAQAGGWVARIRRLVETDDPSRPGPRSEEGFLLCVGAFQKVGSGDVAAALAGFQRAAEVGVSAGDRDLTALARHGEGRALIREGRRAEGFALLDEVMVGITCGEVGPLVAGVVYCSVISACHDTFDWRRAQEWTAALADWCAAHPDMVPFRGACLVRRSEVMQFHGEWSAAADEADRACHWLRDPPGQPELGLALAQLADIHRLRGEFDDADVAYRAASQAGARLLPGLPLLRMAQGQLDTACAAVRRALEDTRDPRKRPLVLRVAVEVRLEAGDTEGARSAADELLALAIELDAPFLRAAAASAAGAVLLAEGDTGGALAALGDAQTRWTDLDAPYELARVRAYLGRACLALDDRDGAMLEFDAALETLERLGATPDAAQVSRWADRASAPEASSDGLTGREIEVLRLVATGRTNRLISTELGISEKTVARHISNIFDKLDLSSRTAATAYAYEHKLI